ncbi:MAG: DUF3108 domain-containing protein [Thermonemataceae bacterium]
MRKLLLYIIPLIFFVGFTSKDSYRVIKQNSFGKGEHIEYLVHYAFVNAGEATIDVSEKLYLVNDRPCYRVDVYGKSIGSLEMVTRIRDFWRSYVDTSSIITHRFYRNIEEGNYRKEETTQFFPNTRKAVIMDEHGKKEITTYPNIQDMVSGFYFVRTLNMEKYQKGEVINVPGILEDDLYELKIQFIGKEEIKTKFGKIDTYVLSPIMPENQLFKGTNPIKVYVSDDKNRVPVKILAELVVGSVEMDIKGYSNLKHDIKFK